MTWLHHELQINGDGEMAYVVGYGAGLGVALQGGLRGS